MAKKTAQSQAMRLSVLGVMAALCFVSNYFRIPFLDSKIHIGNAVCVLCGYLFDPVGGFMSAGMGNLLYDLMSGYGYESIITFVSKGAIALVASLIARQVMDKDIKAQVRIVLGAVAGAVVYVILYMLKTFIFGLTINGLTMDATLIKMGAKLPASTINAVFAIIVTPIFWNALRGPMKKAGILEKL